MNKAKDAGRFPAFLRGLAHSLSESLLFMSASRCVNKVGPLKPPHLVSFQRGRFRNRFDPQNYGKQKVVRQKREIVRFFSVKEDSIARGGEPGLFSSLKLIRSRLLDIPSSRSA